MGCFQAITPFFFFVCFVLRCSVSVCFDTESASRMLFLQPLARRPQQLLLKYTGGTEDGRTRRERGRPTSTWNQSFKKKSPKPFKVLFPFLFTRQLHMLEPNLNPGEFLHRGLASSAEPPTSALASVHLGQQTDANRNWTKTHQRWGLLYIRWSLLWRFPLLICFPLWDSSFYFATHFSPGKVKPDVTPLGVLQPVNKPINGQMKTWQWPWANRLIAAKRPENLEHHRSPVHSPNRRLNILCIFLRKNWVKCVWTKI